MCFFLRIHKTHTKYNVHLVQIHTVPGIYELGQPRLCQNSWLSMPRSIIRILTRFFYTVFLMYQPTFETTSLFSPPREYMTDLKMRKKEKVTITGVKKEKEKGVGSEYICTYVSNIRWKFQSEKVQKSAKLSGAPQINRFFVITWHI